MNTKQALKEAIRRFGKNAAVRDDGKACASTPDARKLAHDEIMRLNAQRKDASLDKVALKEIDEARRQLFGPANRYRFTVGHVAMGMFFSVEGQGDTWELAFAQVDEKAAREKAGYEERQRARKAA